MVTHPRSALGKRNICGSLGREIAIAEFIEGDGAVVVRVHSMEYIAEFWHHLIGELRLMDFGELFVLFSLVQAPFDQEASQGQARHRQVRHGLRDTGTNSR